MTRVLFLLIVAVGAGCGSVCGNGKIEDGEECDDGNVVDGDACSSTCRSVATIDTYVSWRFIEGEWPGHPETCTEVGATSILLQLTGPKPLTQTIDCGFYQIKLSSLPLGDYTVTGTLLDGQTAITRGQAMTAFAAAGTTQSVAVDFPYADFVHSYTGTFFFKVRWNGADTCAAAGVTKQRLLLTRDGVPLAATTELGDALDGSSSPCRDATVSRPQAALGLVWGPATLAVSGEDELGTVLFQQTFDTFVGADLANPPWVVDVAGVAVDAGVVDANGAD